MDAKVKLLPRAGTGIPAFDQVLGGGWARSRLHLLEGSPGTGKTTIALQFLLAGAAGWLHYWMASMTSAIGETGSLQGVRVLVVEDEPLICLLFGDMLSELGCTVVGPAFNFKQACELARSPQEIDIAILDVNLGDRPVFPVADLLADRGVPMLFSTGLGAGGLPLQWQSYGTIPKPVTMDDLASGLSRTLATRRHG